MSACDNGTCKCCPRCGCRATCTCNRSLGFEGATDMKSFAMETGKCSNNCSPSCPNAATTTSSSATDVNVDFFFFAVAAGGTGKCGCNPHGCTCYCAKEDFRNCSEFSDEA